MAGRTKVLPASFTGVPDQHRGPGGYMVVENPDVIADLIISSPHKQSKYVRSRRLGPAEEETINETTIKLHKKEDVDISHLLVLEAKKERQEKKLPAVLQRVDKATEFLDTVERELQLSDEAKRNKVRRQFEEWNTSVHGTIQKKIAASIEAMDKKELNKKKNQDYEKFLNVTNRKPAIFRDIIIESEYDPLEPNRRCIKAQTGKLHDPPKLGLQKAEREAGTLGSAGGARAAKEPLGKNTLNVELWASGQIEATPYGMFSKMMDKPRTGSGLQSEAGASSGSKSATLRSHVVFDHFSFPTGKDAVEPELPRGKRIFPTAVYSDPGRVFGHLPPAVEREIAAIRPPEDRRPF